MFFLNLEIWYLATTHGGKNTWWMIKYPHIKKNAQRFFYPAIQVWLCVSYDQMNGVHCHVVSVWLVIEPWVKFGTTGTAWAGASMTLAPTTLRTDQSIVFPKVMTTSVISQ